MKNNAHVKWLKDEGAIIEEDNVVHASRAFMANSVLKWCVRKTKENSSFRINYYFITIYKRFGIYFTK